MGTKDAPGKFDCYANAAPDEPMFVLLGRDPMGGALVRTWAELRERLGEDPAKVAEARTCADAMDAYARRLGKEIHRARRPIVSVSDEVDRPSHYTAHLSGVEAIEVCEHLSFCFGNVVKYVWRVGKKSDEEEVTALRKARWYAARARDRGEQVELSFGFMDKIDRVLRHTEMDAPLFGVLGVFMVEANYDRRFVELVAHDVGVKCVEILDAAIAARTGERRGP